MAGKADQECPTPNGTLLIIGGKENKGEEEPDNKKAPINFVKLQVLEKFRELIHKKNPLVEVITTSTTEPKEVFSEYKKVLNELEINQVNHIHHNNRKDLLEDKDVIERIKKADAFFFTGGDQLKLTSIYGGSIFLTILKERYINNKIVVAGTSAGAMALSTPMIYAGNDEVQELVGEIKITTGLEFLKDVCIDTHFVHRGRFVRMAQVIVTNPTCIGIGIEEDTAVIVQNGFEAEVVGTGTVIIMEGFDIEAASIGDFSSEKPVTIRNIKMHILADEEKYIIPMVNPPHK
jgi:cyanophycinase